MKKEKNIQIKNINGEVIYTSNKNTIKEALEEAVKNNKNLKDANLSDAYLSRADLSDADLSGAYMSRANLREDEINTLLKAIGIIIEK